MPRQHWYWLLLGIAILGKAEILDRIAVTVDKAVITESAIQKHIRVTAFLRNEPGDLSVDARRAAAARLVEQALIRREIEISLYPMPSENEVQDQIDNVKKISFPDLAKYRLKLEQDGLTEDDLRESFRSQLVMLHFIEYRFRPGVNVTDAEVRQYYQEEFLPEFADKESGQAPTFEDSRDRIEEILVNHRINQALDAWLDREKKQANIRYREEAFERSRDNVVEHLQEVTEQ